MARVDFGRALLRGLRLAWSRDTALRQFVQQAQIIARLLEKISDHVGSRRVLVPRLIGLEDSSRHWSPFMIAQHLFIVNRDALVIIEALCAGQVPVGEVRIANIKPRSETEIEARSRILKASWLSMSAVCRISPAGRAEVVIGIRGSVR